MTNNSTDTPRTDAAEMPIDRIDTSASRPDCVVHADYARELERELAASNCALDQMTEDAVKLKDALEELQQQKRNCMEIIDDDAKEKSELKAEVERLAGRMKEAEELIRGLHDGWKKARKAHLETCKNAQTEIDKLHTENVCLQELIQEFYEWSRRDYPTEAEVREIMDRYYNLLNKYKLTV